MGTVWKGSDELSAEDMLEAMRGLAADATLADKERRKRQNLVATWEKRIAAEDRREAEAARKLREAVDRAEAAERDAAILLDKLRRWKAFFEGAMRAKRQLEQVRRCRGMRVEDALAQVDGQGEAGEPAHACAPERAGWHATYADHGCGDCGVRANCARAKCDPTVHVCSLWEA